MILTALVRAYKHFRATIPKRWQLVSQFVARYSDSCSRRAPTFEVGVGTTTLTFDGSPDHCRRVCRDLEVHHSHLLTVTEQQAQILFTDASTNAFKPIVHLPPTSTCCGRNVFIRYVYKLCHTLLILIKAHECPLVSPSHAQWDDPC